MPPLTINPRKILVQLIKLQNAFNNRVNDFQPAYTAFGIFGVLNYPIFYFIWITYSTQSYESCSIRVTATLLSLFLLLHKYWPTWLRSWLPLYWYFTLAFCLPFFFFYMLFQNGESAPWLMAANCVIFWLLFLVPFTDYVILLLSGIIIAYIAYALPQNSLLDINFLKWWGIWAQILGSFIVGFFAKRKFSLDKEKLQSTKFLAETIAHELRTPLASIKGGADGLKFYLPTLIEAYQLAQNAKLGSLKAIRQTQFEALEHALIAIEKEADASNLIINMLLTNLSTQQLKSKDFITLSINACIDEALTRYPMTPEIVKKIHWVKSTDFNFQGSEILTIHLLFNLLKNSIYYIRAACKGEIFIHVDPATRKVFFKDTGAGISAEDLDHIFKAFYSKTRHGTGVGLAFCKSVMTAYGGNIKCNSVKGEYTEFILSFPRGEKHVN